MKNILVPTDFSDAADSALDYAVELAKKFNAKLILVHAYHVPLVSAEVPVPLPTLDQIDKDTKHALAKVQNSLHLKHGYELKVECHALCGFAADEIITFASTKPVDLIVMGMRGAGIIEEKLVGSVSTAVIEKVKVPVLTLDKNVKFHRPAKLVFATDHKETSPASLKALNEFATTFNTHVYVLNIVPIAYAIPSLEEAQNGVKMEHSIEETDHSYHYAENDDVIEGINHFAKKHNADMVVMLARQHGLFYRLVHESHTKKMAFHSNIPVLALHES